MKKQIYTFLKNTIGGRGLGRYAVYRKARALAFFFLKEKTIDINGCKLHMDTEHGVDFLGELTGHGFEISTTEFFKKEIKPGYTVLDIGADIGYYTCLFAKLAGPEGKVFSFEPNPNSIKILRKNVSENNLKNVTIIEKAVADRNYKDIFYPVGPHSSFGYDRFHGTQGKGVEVNCARVDDVINGKVDFIKMDVEGSEWKAVKGMEKLFERNPKVKLLTEFCPELLRMSGGNPRDFVNDLKNRGFKLYDVNEENGQERDVDYFVSSYDKPTVDGKINVTNILCVK